jgi:hypothetical protein
MSSNLNKKSYFKESRTKASNLDYGRQVRTGTAPSGSGDPNSFGSPVFNGSLFFPIPKIPQENFELSKNI